MFFLFGCSADMGPSSWIAPWEAKKCYNGLAWRLLQESSVSLKIGGVLHQLVSVIMSEQAWILQQKEGMFHSCELRWFSQITMKMILTFGNLSSPFTNFEFS